MRQLRIWTLHGNVQINTNECDTISYLHQLIVALSNINTTMRRRNLDVAAGLQDDLLLFILVTNWSANTPVLELCTNCNDPFALNYRERPALAAHYLYPSRCTSLTMQTLVE